MLIRTLLVFALALGGAPVWAARPEPPKRTTPVVLPDGTTIRAEIADTEGTRERGLMFRTSLGATEGMLFVFDTLGLYPFWMKNTLIPLDMLWISPERRVVYIAENVPPCKADPCPSYPPMQKALYVLELAAGSATKHHLKIGDALTFESPAAR